MPFQAVFQNEINDLAFVSFSLYRFFFIILIGQITLSHLSFRTRVGRVRLLKTEPRPLYGFIFQAVNSTNCRSSVSKVKRITEGWDIGNIYV